MTEVATNLTSDESAKCAKQDCRLLVSENKSCRIISEAIEHDKEILAQRPHLEKTPRHERLKAIVKAIADHKLDDDSPADNCPREFHRTHQTSRLFSSFKR